MIDLQLFAIAMLALAAGIGLVGLAHWRIGGGVKDDDVERW